VVHTEIDGNRKEWDPHVQIAILDTGVDVNHPDIRNALDRKQIKGFFPESWGPDSPLDPRHDDNGHGTHGTSVLIKTAPNVKIYVARVADKEGKVIYNCVVEVYVYSFSLLTKYRQSGGQLKTTLTSFQSLGDLIKRFLLLQKKSTML